MRWARYDLGVANLELVLVVLLLVIPVTLLTGTALLPTPSLSSLRRANGLVPKRSAVTPPLWWLWSPGKGAMLHRRLRSACQMVAPVAKSRARGRRWPSHKAEPPRDGIADLAREVLQEAILLDHHVVSASRTARGLRRAQALAVLDYEVRAVEDAARRVHQLATRRAQLARPTSPGVLSLDQNIAAMESALSEFTAPGS
jgi:hypothetical protein